MWVARDKSGFLQLFRIKPRRLTDFWYVDSLDGFNLDKKLFPDLKWEDEPIEVSILSKPTDTKIKDFALSQDWKRFGPEYDIKSCTLGYECGCLDVLNGLI